MPTCIELAQTQYPKEYKGHRIMPYEGKSLSSVFNSHAYSNSRPLFFEHGGHKALRKGQWKLVSTKKSSWELYNIGDDPTELNDLSSQYPELKNELIKQYQTWWSRVTSTKSYEKYR